VGEEAAVGGVEVAGRSRDHECGRNEHRERQVPGEPGDCDRHEDERANEIGGDHHAPSVPAVRDDPTVEPEHERRHAVRETDGDHAERAARDEREPHERDVLEGVTELADRDGRVGAAEVPPPQQRGGRLPSRRLLRKRRRQLGADRLCHLGSGG
jgi:hypothetical protein